MGVKRLSQRAGRGWPALPEGQEWSGGTPGVLGGIGRNGMGWEFPQEGWEDWEAFWESQAGLGGPPRVQGWVRSPSRRDGRARRG